MSNEEKLLNALSNLVFCIKHYRYDGDNEGAVAEAIAHAEDLIKELIWQ